MKQPPLILASSSDTRKALLNRLGLQYRCISPDIDELPRVRHMQMNLQGDWLLTKLILLPDFTLKQ